MAATASSSFTPGSRYVFGGKCKRGSWTANESTATPGTDVSRPMSMTDIARGAAWPYYTAYGRSILCSTSDEEGPGIYILPNTHLKSSMVTLRADVLISSSKASHTSRKAAGCTLKNASRRNETVLIVSIGAGGCTLTEGAGL